MSKLSIATAKYSDRHIITRNRRRIRSLYRNMPKYTIDRDTWLVRHGQWLSHKRSDRAIKARVEHSFKACGYTEAQIVTWIEQNKRRQSRNASLNGSSSPVSPQHSAP